MQQSSKCAHVIVTLALFSGTARADLSDWVNAVAAGSPSSFVSTTVVVPSVVDIGTLSQPGGLTYEFLVNATNAGLSSALMGARNTGFGTNSALKFEQYADTMSFGITSAGVADWIIAPNAENQDLHVAFVVDTAGATTELFVDGVAMGMAPYAPFLTNQVGLGQWYDPAASVDFLTGTIYGFAVYESALPAAEVLEHATAFHNTILGTPFCFGLGCPCGNDDANGGCMNSSGSGAQLEALGSASFGANDLALLGKFLTANSPAILFAGTMQMNAGAGVIFGDGLRCAGGPLQRLGVRNADSGGNAMWGPGVLGGASWAAPGDTRYLQIWTLDPMFGPCGGGFNTSHGLELVLLP